MTEPIANIVPLYEHQLQSLMRDAIRTATDGGGGGGSSGGLDIKVAVLEAHVEVLRKDVIDMKSSLVDIRLQLATLTERIAHLPSKGYTVTVALAVMAVVAAFTTFQQQIQHFVHLGP